MRGQVGGFQNDNAWLAARVYFLPLPHPSPSYFCSRPFFHAAKMPKTPFFVLCSAETLATQANGRHMNYVMYFSFALLGRSVGLYKQIMQARILVLVPELRDQAPRVNFALTPGRAETPIISSVDLFNKI